MKQTCILLGLVLTLLACSTKDQPVPTPEPTPTIDTTELAKACRYIQGGGENAIGGSMGKVMYVTLLTDERDPATGLPMRGTLRYAAEYQSGARLVLFNVAGTIHLNTPLHIRNSHITILGQSAPGQGVCVADYPIIVEAHNVIVRFIRCRLGNESLQVDPNQDYDALSVNNAKKIVIDHCSCSWSVDECVSCYGNENFTLQYCFITESLRNAGHVKGAHGYGGIWGGKNASFHHNLLAHHDSRNPRFDHDYVDSQHAGPIDYVNNVVYNWGSNSTYGGEGTDEGAGGRHVNMVNNYYKYGPSTKTKVKSRLVDPTVSCSNCVSSPGGTVVPPVIYLAGNTMVGFEDVTANNWLGSTQSKEKAGTDTRWTMSSLSSEEMAATAYETVLEKAGCSLSRDAVDIRIVEEVRNGTGRLIDNPSEVGGWPELKDAPRPTDTDNDGMPDEWETKYGLNPTDAADALVSTLISGMQNLEVYWNDVVKHLY